MMWITCAKLVWHGHEIRVLGNFGRTSTYHRMKDPSNLASVTLGIEHPPPHTCICLEILASTPSHGPGSFVQIN